MKFVKNKRGSLVKDVKKKKKNYNQKQKFKNQNKIIHMIFGP